MLDDTLAALLDAHTQMCMEARVIRMGQGVEHARA